MNRQDILKTCEKFWETEAGYALFSQQPVFRGKKLHEEFRDASWFDLLMYGITGNRLPASTLRLLEKIWIFTSYPDPRIWNNRIATIVATTRGTGVSAISAAIAASEAEIYGGGPLLRAHSLFDWLAGRIEQGDGLSKAINDYKAKFGTLSGFGRPIDVPDERITPLLDAMDSEGIAQGKAVKLAFRVEERLVSKNKRLRLNYAGLVAAVFIDFGLSARDLYYFCIFIFSAGMFPLVIEASQKPQGTFFPMRCERIDYRGPARRSWDDNPA